MFQTYVHFSSPFLLSPTIIWVNSYLSQMSPLMFSKMQLITTLLILTSFASINKSLKKLIF